MKIVLVLALVLAMAAAENCTCATAEQMNKIIEQNHEIITALKKQQSQTSELLSKDDTIYTLGSVLDDLVYWTEYAYKCVFVVSKHADVIGAEIAKNMKEMHDNKQEWPNADEILESMKKNRATFGK